MRPVKNQKNNRPLVQLSPIEVPVFNEAALQQTVRISPDGHRKHPLLVLQNDRLGHVEPPEGTRLLADLISQFVIMEALPSAVILQGNAVRLAAGANPALEILSSLISLHVPLLICSESLETLKTVVRIEGARRVSQREIAEQLLMAEQIFWL